MTPERDDHCESGRDTRSVLIEYGQLEKFEKRLAALNKKAIAFGLEPIKVLDVETVRFARTFEYVGQDMDRQLVSINPAPTGEIVEHPVLLKKITLDYPIVKLGDWYVVGKLEAANGGNLTFAVTEDPDDVDALRAHAGSEINCEHCSTKRNRKDSYLLRNQRGSEYKQVGSKCLEDFTGINPAAALFLAQMYAFVALCDDEFGETLRSTRDNAIDTIRFLANVSFLADTNGFVTTAKAKDTPGLRATYAEASSLLDDLRRDPSLQEKYDRLIPQHLVKAETIREWFERSELDTDFYRNVRLLLKDDAISLDRKHLAFAAAAVPVYNAQIRVDAVRNASSAHVGTAGEKMDAKLTIDRVLSMQSYYGPASLVLLSDGEGNQLTWRTTNCPSEVVEAEGRTVDATFKIKGHGNYRGKAQTYVTHFKVREWLGRADNKTNDEVTHGPSL
jgi:hypothetical protein